MADDSDHTGPAAPESQLPYDTWTEQAMRHVAIRALKHAALNGLPGDHHFYLTFRTDDPGTVIPPRLRAQYPQEMTIVIQHQFWDLVVDEGDGGADAGHVSIGLSFGGVASVLVIPFVAITAFADPFVHFGIRFSYTPAPLGIDLPISTDAGAPDAPPPTAAPPQIVSLDAFRRRTPPREI